MTANNAPTDCTVRLIPLPTASAQHVNIITVTAAQCLVRERYQLAQLTMLLLLAAFQTNPATQYDLLFL